MGILERHGIAVDGVTMETEVALVAAVVRSLSSNNLKVASLRMRMRMRFPFQNGSRQFVPHIISADEFFPHQPSPLARPSGIKDGCVGGASYVFHHHHHHHYDIFFS